MLERKQNEVHHGQNIKRIRIAQKIKQAALASDMGVSQQTIARMETQKTIPDRKIKMAAKALSVPEEIIKQKEEDAVSIVFENNTFENGCIPNSVFGRVENYNSVENLKELLDHQTKLFTQILQHKNNY